MGQKMQPLVTYWLAGEERKNSTTGKVMSPEVGPYCLIENGCAYREYTDAEVKAYVRRIHGEDPIRIERKPRSGTPSD